jgi:hypothetical protein
MNGSENAEEGTKPRMAMKRDLILINEWLSLEKGLSKMNLRIWSEWNIYHTTRNWHSYTLLNNFCSRRFFAGRHGI